MYRALLRKPTAALAANIFDPLPARIARIVGYERAADSVYPQDLRGDNLLEFMT